MMGRGTTAWPQLRGTGTELPALTAALDSLPGIPLSQRLHRSRPRDSRHLRAATPGLAVAGQRVRPAVKPGTREWLALPDGRVRSVVTVDSELLTPAAAARAAAPKCACGRARRARAQSCGAAECVARLWARPESGS
jgi:hypothetical protein